MIYYDPITIDVLAKDIFSRPGLMMNLDKRDYDTFTLGRTSVCAARVTSDDLSELISELKADLDNLTYAGTAAEVMINMTMNPVSEMTMDIYAAIRQLIYDIYGEKILIKFGFSSDDSLTVSNKDIVVFIAID